MQTYKTAHSTLGVEFTLFYEGFDEPITKLRCTRSRRKSGLLPRDWSYRDADSVKAQLLQSFNVVLGEPGLPMLIEGFVGGVRM